VLWGPARVQLYNDAYIPIAGNRHPGALGRPAAETWAEAYPAFLGPVLDRAFAGEAVAVEDQTVHLRGAGGRPEERVFSASFSPIHDETGAVGGVFHPLVERTEAVRAERQRALLLRLSDAERQSSDPLAILAAADEALSGELGAVRVGYAEVEADGERFVLLHEHRREDLPSVDGQGRIADFGDALARELLAGRTVVVGDVSADARTAGAAAAHAAFGTRALVAVPILREGRLRATLHVNAEAPRTWTTAEVELIREVAERTWSAVERARSEHALRESEGQFRLMADAVPQIVWITDAEGGVEFFNRQWMDYTGVPELLPTAARVAANHVHPEDETRTMVAFNEARRTGRTFQTEHRIRSAAGQYRWFLVRGEPYRDPDTGEVVRWFGASVDIHDRKLAEEALRRSEEQLRLATEAAEVGFWDVDPLTDELVWPPRVKAMFGISADRPVTMRDFYAGLHPDDLRATTDAFAAALDPGRRALYDVEYRTIGKEDGQVRWVAAKGRGVFDETGRCIRVIGTAIDITARKAVEERLRDLNATLEARVAEQAAERDRIWRMSRDLLAIMGFDGYLKAINPAWERTLGLDMATLLDRPMAEQVHPDDHAPAREVIERLRRGETVERFEDRLRHADGSWRWIAWTLVPEGDVFYAVGRDVTEDKRRAEALRLYQNIVQSDRFPICAYDTEMRVIAFNKAHADEFFRILGHRQQVGDLFPDLFPPDQAPVVRAFTERALRGEVFTIEGEFGDPDHAKPAWESDFAPLRDEEGRIIGAFHHARDVSARLRAEAELQAAQEALRQSQKMEAVGHLTGGIAHDFNNLLQSMAGSLDLIRRKADSPERVRRYAEAGLQAAERGARLTGQLLAFSRAQRIELKPLVVAEVITGMRDLLQRSLGPMVRIDLDLSDEATPVLSDPTQLEMAVLNLAINARDAMPGGGTLTVATAVRRIGKDPELAPGEYVEVSVADTGTGMPPEVAARAFDPFFTTKEVGQGTGLGLSQVYGIARQAGGTARLESRPGRGTTVRILLPRTEALLRPDAGATPERLAAAPVAAKVLVVDDDPDVRRVLTDMLDVLGYAVSEAADGPSGLEALAAQGPDLLIVDFAMPGMNGAEVARAAHARRPSLPVVFASGYSDTAAIESAAGPKAVMLRKPFRMEELQAVLAEALTG
jgi:PAS domain S-box-containing protein